MDKMLTMARRENVNANNEANFLAGASDYECLLCGRKVTLDNSASTRGKDLCCTRCLYLVGDMFNLKDPILYLHKMKGDRK